MTENNAEFTHSPVPQDRMINAWQIALIKIGIVIALPGFMAGAQIGYQMGLTRSTLTFFAGSFILAALAAATATVGARSHLPTSMITQFAFGRIGSRVINLILGISLLGWFGVTAELFGNTLAKVVADLWQVEPGEIVFTLVGGSLMVLTTIFGFKALSKLANLAVPVLFVGLLIISYLACRDKSLASLLVAPLGATSLGVGISAIVGGPSVGTVIFPDLVRFAKSVNHGRAAAVMSYGIGFPLILVFVALASIATGQKDLLLIMIGLGLGVPALLFLVFTAWTTNAGNLYSSSLFISNLLPRAPYRQIVLGAGMVGVAIALLKLTENFIPFLVALGISIPPIAGIYVADFFLRDQKLDVSRLPASPAIRPTAFMAWGLGILVAYLALKDVLILTTIPSVDSILVAALGYLGMERIRRSVFPERIETKAGAGG